MRKLTKQIKQWINKQQDWFTSWQLDEALKIKTKGNKRLRRVTTKRMCDKGFLVRPPQTTGGVFRVTKSARRIK